MNKNYKLYSYFISGLSVIALMFVYTLELFDIYPCRLCIYQRYVYYGLIISSISILFFISRRSEKAALFLEWIVYCLLLIGIGIGVFQLLIENHLIKYESACTTNIGNIASPEELFSSINSKDLVACDVPQIEVFNLSLSGWNVLYMISMLCVSLLIMYKKRKN
jgi:disulfide bond formation protein DsbB